MQQRARILFVDDEPDVLDGLQRSLRRERPKWDMHFANSGAMTLDLLRVQPADIVVSDLRMPGMDGAVLLGHIKREFPRTMRIVLSGYADSELFERAWPLAHLMLTKPCEHHALRAAIARMVGDETPAPAPAPRAVAR
jgi:DNA-binding NtrC family response regulator